MIEGFVGQLLPDKILGWAFDRDLPNVHLIIDVYCGKRQLGSIAANVYRPDLAQKGIGGGDHGFLFLLSTPFGPSELDEVSVRARLESDPTSVKELARYLRKREKAAPVESETSYKDDTQYPVFVLGAPRSGTSAVAQALGIATRYGGYNEGQVLDLLNPLQHALGRFYQSKARIPPTDRETMMIMKFPESYFVDAISALFADTMRKLFPSHHWCDKTPTVDMIWAAPAFRKIWPNAKFIFLKRRAFENLRSRILKFREVSFEDQCLEWTANMKAWRVIREELGGSALELDQHFLAQHPKRSARAIGALLALAPAEIAELGRVLRRHQPERTTANVLDVSDAAALNWEPAQWAVFDRVCGPVMAAYGYSRDLSYYAAGAEDRSCLVL
jgi:Sulfotransferase family